MNAPTKIAMPMVYAKIAAVQSALSRTGISKSRRNAGQGYNFRGIDEVYAALSPLLAEHGLCILPRIVSREVVERASAKGGALFNVTVEAEFDFVAAEDSSMHTIRTFGEAMDSADKATNKAMSAAYKYAALMAFAIPTEGDNDADATSHDVEPSAAKPDVISPADLTKIQMLLKATSIDEISFLRKMGAPKGAMLCDMPSSMVGEGIERLEAALAKMAKQETDAKAPASSFAEELDDVIPF